jgi:hypothetical protein
MQEALREGEGLGASSRRVLSCMSRCIAVRITKLIKDE